MALKYIFLFVSLSFPLFPNQRYIHTHLILTHRAFHCYLHASLVKFMRSPVHTSTDGTFVPGCFCLRASRDKVRQSGLEKERKRKKNNPLCKSLLVSRLPNVLPLFSSPSSMHTVSCVCFLFFLSSWCFFISCSFYSTPTTREIVTCILVTFIVADKSTNDYTNWVKIKQVQRKWKCCRCLLNVIIDWQLKYHSHVYIHSWRTQTVYFIVKKLEQNIN